MSDTVTKRSTSLSVFLCHASSDKPAVRELYRILLAEGFNPWLDEESLLPGQNWKEEIAKAVRTSDIVIVCLSNTSIGKDGFVQKEIRFALDKADEKPDGSIFIIPARLEECEIPDQLGKWHWVNLFEEQGQKRLIAALGQRRQITAKLQGPRVTTVIAKKGYVHHVGLTADDCRFLGEVVEAVGLSQKALAGLADVRESWLSKVLNERRSNVDQKMLERLASALVKRLESDQVNTTFSDELKRHALTWLSRFTVVNLIPSAIYHAGGPLPVDASHYINRRADDVAVTGLSRLPFTMLVSGPVQCGKSSLLARLERKARDVAIETAWFDPRIFITHRSGSATEQFEIQATAATMLSELLQVQWGLAPPRNQPTDSIIKLVHWLSGALKPTAHRPRLLIIDDLASLGARSVEDWVSLFIRAMAQRSQLSIAVGLTHHFGSSFSRRILNLSSVVHWSPRIELGWLERAEVTELDRMLSETSPEKYDLYDLFAGQPFLTHAAAVDRDFWESVRRWTCDASEVNARPVRGSRPYRQHLNVIRFAILGPMLNVDSDTRKLLQALVDACSGEVSLDRDQLRFFITIRLLNEAANPTLSIYRLMAEDLSQEIG